MNTEEFPKLSSNNRDELIKHEQSGCYFCIRTFGSGEVTEFTDGGRTALCPRCNVDAVLPGITDAIFLAQGLRRWFTGTKLPNETIR